MDWSDSVFITVSSVAGTLLIMVVVWQISRIIQTTITTRAQRGQAEEVRALAERAVAANRQSAEELARLTQMVSETSARVEAIERMLRDVA